MKDLSATHFGCEKHIMEKYIKTVLKRTNENVFGPILVYQTINLFS